MIWMSVESVESGNFWHFLTCSETTLFGLGWIPLNLGEAGEFPNWFVNLGPLGLDGSWLLNRSQTKLVIFGARWECGR